MVNRTEEGGAAPMSPREQQMYEQEYRHGAQLFRKALQQYAKSDNPAQQKEFHNVMNKALNVLNETARELNRKALLDQNTRIVKDYEAFNHAPKDAGTLRKLEHDLEKAQASIKS